MFAIILFACHSFAPLCLQLDKQQLGVNCALLHLLHSLRISFFKRHGGAARGWREKSKRKTADRNNVNKFKQMVFGVENDFEVWL